MNQKIKAPFSIGDTAKMTGVTQKQIRNWEARGYITKADRVVCGERAYRYFSADQIGKGDRYFMLDREQRSCD